jgi:virginiamycin B lyase
MAHPWTQSAAPVRRKRAGATGLLLAGMMVLAVAPGAQAATATNAWLAKIGTSGANGTATMSAYTTGTGSLVLKLKRLPASRTLAVTLLKASCKGSTLLTLASVKTASTGAATKTTSLTAAQVTTIKKATTGTAKIAVRIGTGTTAKCGLFAAQLVPAYAAAKVTVGRSPSGVVIDASGVWVTNWWDNTLTRIDPATNTVLNTIPVALTGVEGPEAITTGAGSLWLTTTAFSETETLAGHVLRIDPATGTVLATINAGRGAFEIAFGFGSIWIANEVDGTIQRIDPATNTVVASIPVPSAEGIAFDLTSVWVVDLNGGVERIDPATNTVVATIHTQTTGGYIAVAGTSIWVTNPGTKGSANGSVSRIDPVTSTVTANIPVGDSPVELAVAGGSIWVGMMGESAVVRINAATNTITSKVAVSSSVYSIAATSHAVWAAHNLPIPTGGTEPPVGSVTRIAY